MILLLMFFFFQINGWPASRWTIKSWYSVFWIVSVRTERKRLKAIWWVVIPFSMILLSTLQDIKTYQKNTLDCVFDWQVFFFSFFWKLKNKQTNVSAFSDFWRHVSTVFPVLISCKVWFKQLLRVCKSCSKVGAVTLSHLKRQV